MAQQIQSRHGTAAQWTTANPLLAVGEIGAETDTNRFKIGNGSTYWNSLGYATGLQWKGAWSSATAYVVNDVVTTSNVVYISILAGTNQAPATSPTYWSVMVTGSGNVSGPGSSVSGDIVTFSGTSGTLIQDSGKVLPSGTVVGTTDTQTLTNKTITGLTSASTVLDSAGTGYQVGYRQMPINSQTVATYTTVLSDDAKGIYATGQTTSTFTIPSSTYTTGTVITIFNGNTGAMTVNGPASGLQLINGALASTRTIAAKGSGTFVLVAANLWYCAGGGMT